MPDERYLMVFGTLRADHRLELIAPYLSDRRMPRPEGSGPPLDVELLDGAGRLLLRDVLLTAPLCGEGVESDDRIVRGAVPFRDDARRIRFSYRGAVVLETPVSRA